MQYIEEKNNENKITKLNKIDYNPQCYITHDKISVDYVISMLSKNKECIGKILNGRIQGIVFLCKITFLDFSNLIPVLFTCNHNLNKYSIKEGNTIYLTFNDQYEKRIKMDKSRKFYSNEYFDTTIIEIKVENKFDETKFLEIDTERFKNYEKKISIYFIIQMIKILKYLLEQ